MPLLQNASLGKQFFALILILVGSVFLITPLGILLAVPFVNGNIFELIGEMELAQSPEQIALLKYFQIVSQLGLFIISSFVFAALVSKKVFRFLGLANPVKIGLLTLAIILGLVSAPFISWIMELNMKMHLPDFLSGLETWMRQSEIKTDKLTTVFLSGNTWGNFAVNFLMMAILAGLGEELLLRGVFQPMLIRFTKNAHAGIWLTAALFSFIHFQFFGFFPRMLLGLLFGYYFYWSRSLWIPIIAHVVNNGIIVVYAFIEGPEEIIPVLGSNGEQSSFLIVVLSLILSSTGLYIFYKQRPPALNV